MAAVRQGYLANSIWSIRLEGVSDWSRKQLIHYLNLFNAFDQIYGFKISPKKIHIQTVDSFESLELSQNGYVLIDPEQVENIDTILYLQQEVSPGEVLPQLGNVPQVICLYC